MRKINIPSSCAHKSLAYRAHNESENEHNSTYTILPEQRQVGLWLFWQQ